MSDWFQKNAISLIIAIATLVSTWAVYGYRLNTLETKVDNQATALNDVRNTNVSTLVELGKISVSLDNIKQQQSEIKDQLSKISK